MIIMMIIIIIILSIIHFTISSPETHNETIILLLALKPCTDETKIMRISFPCQNDSKT